VESSTRVSSSLVDDELSFLRKSCRLQSPLIRAMKANGTRWGEAAGSRSPAPIVEELLAQMERQPPAPQESTEPAAAAAEEVVAAGA
jgi:hypothetical protein